MTKVEFCQGEDYLVRDLSLASTGHKKIDWAYDNMPVLRIIEESFKQNKPLQGLNVAISIHVEAKTACLAKVIQAAGANVTLTGCNPLSTQDDVAAALVEDGLKVFCFHDSTPEEYKAHLSLALGTAPDLIIDDGGDFAWLLHTSHSHLLKSVKGGCEETTTGVHRLEILAKEKRLAYPVMAVNNAKCKHLFDNRYGTGQSALTAIMTSTNLSIAGKKIVIAGYGMCGKGLALRAKGLGAQVIITEIDGIAAGEALMEGYQVMTMNEAASVGDIFITVTGCKDVITHKHFLLMKDQAILCNAGHFDVEINLKELESLSKEKKDLRQNLQGYILNTGKTIVVIGQGRLVNLAAGDGHPVEIMDMSFALQALSVVYMAENFHHLSKEVYSIPLDIDQKVANLLLKSKGITIDTLTLEQEQYVSHWEI